MRVSVLQPHIPDSGTVGIGRALVTVRECKPGNRYCKLW
jgi:hypothetical protein